MSTIRVITDIPRERVNFVLSLIQADGGTVVEQQPEPDGEVTIVAELPGIAAARSASTTDGTPTFRWMQLAQAELGQAEGGPQGSNPRIEAYHATTRGGAGPDSVPWCSSFVNFCVKGAGFVGTDSKSARSWLAWGTEAGEFIPGCVVVLQRGSPPKGHVGFYVGTDAGRVRLLGGNQGDRVSIASFDADRVLARRVLF